MTSIIKKNNNKINSPNKTILPPISSVSSPKSKVSVQKSTKNDKFKPPLIDAETDEPLNFTTDQWSILEGRTDLSINSILAYGTGNTILKSQSINQNSINQCNPSPEIKKRLKILEEEGPLNIFYRKKINNKDNNINNKNNRLKEMLNKLNEMKNEENNEDNKEDNKKDNKEDNKEDNNNKEQIENDDDNNIEINSLYEKTMTNTHSLSSLTQSYFNELYNICAPIEKNKVITGSPPYPGGIDALKDACLKLAEFKAKNTIYYINSIHIESIRERKRQIKLHEHSDSITDIYHLNKVNEEKRLMATKVLRGLKRDHEILEANMIIELGLDIFI